MAESPELSDVTDGAKRRLDQQERKRTEQPARGREGGGGGAMEGGGGMEKEEFNVSDNGPGQTPPAGK